MIANTQKELTGRSDESNYPLMCPEVGSFVGFKRLQDDRIAMLRIPFYARRSSGYGRECRADRAEVLMIESVDRKRFFSCGRSLIDDQFIYHVGDPVCVDNFDKDRFKEHGFGIYFFITRQEAVDYRMYDTEIKK